MTMYRGAGHTRDGLARSVSMEPRGEKAAPILAKMGKEKVQIEKKR